ncbi:ATP-binding protein [Microgenomates group bacterium]|nr:ATP-binding protein [Microgenomates group bacterium]
MTPFWKTILAEWTQNTLPEIYPREEEISVSGFGQLKKILVVTGFRRTGKTYLMLSAVAKLLQKYSRKDVFYLNFEDERIPGTTQTLTDLLPAFQAFFGQKPKFLFLDEAQNVPLWSKYVRRILDKENIQIFLTGSSSKMSSFELPTELRGRSLEQKVSPLNFREFLIFKKEALDKEKLSFYPEEKARFDFLFNEYLTLGGLPEIVRARTEDKINILQEYFRTVLKNEEPLKTMAKLLLNSTYFSLSKIHRDLISQGVKIGKNTVNNYFSYLSSAYLFAPIPHFSFSLRHQMTRPQKAFFVDNGFITTLSTKFSQNTGRLLENLVAWHLRLKGKEVYYFQNERKTDEVDFVVLENGRPEELIQVCFDLSDRETQKREFGALLRTGKKLPCGSLKIITASQQEKISFPTPIKAISLADFFLLS